MNDAQYDLSESAGNPGILAGLLSIIRTGVIALVLIAEEDVDVVVLHGPPREVETRNNGRPRARSARFEVARLERFAAGWHTE